MHNFHGGPRLIGPEVSSGLKNWCRFALSIFDHVLTPNVQNSSPNQGTATVQVTVTASPSVAISYVSIVWPNPPSLI